MQAPTNTRTIHGTRASDIEPKAWPSGTYLDLVTAIREVLPAEWRVLPDGRSTASVIAATYAARADSHV